MTHKFTIQGRYSYEVRLHGLDVEFVDVWDIDKTLPMFKLLKDGIEWSRGQEKTKGENEQ